MHHGSSNDERVFDTVGGVRNMEERFENLRRSAACARLNREQVSELIAITANLLEERKRILAMLARIPERFGEVRQLLNELSRTVR